MRRRSAGSGRTVAARALARLGHVWTELRVSGPGHLRFRSACRTTLSFAATTAVFGALLARHEVPVLAAGIAILFSIMAASLPREPAPRARLVTVLAMALSGSVSAAVAAFLSEWPYLGEAGFIVVLIVAVAFQSRGTRAVQAGLIAVVFFYLTLFLRAGFDQVVPAIAVFPVAVAIVLAVTFSIAPERPRKVLARVVRSVEGRGALLLHAIEAAENDGDIVARLRRRRLISSLNEAILSAEDQLAVIDPGLVDGVSLALMRFELALTRVAVAATAARPLRPGDRARIRLAAMRLHARRWSPLRDRRDRSAAATPILAALREVEGAVAEMADTLVDHESRPVAPPAAGAAPPAALPALAWRSAARAGLATLLSICGGYLISPDRWFWAVLTAYVLFLGARSRGDTMVKGVQRVWGSLVGLVVGVLVSVVLAGHPVLEGAGLLVCVFGLAYVFAISPTLSIFCVTVLLGLIYSLLGAGAETILVLRLEETAIGATAAILVGLFFLPRRTHDHVDDTGATLLATLGDVMRLSARRLGGDPSAAPVARMRQADRLLRDLRAALLPLQAGRALVWWARRQAELPAILTCMFWVRVLAARSETGGPSDAAPDAAARADALAARFAALGRTAGPTAGRTARTGAETADIDDPLWADTPHADTPHADTPHAGAPATRAARPGAGFLDTTLDNVEDALTLLSGRLAAEGWNALIAKRPL